LRAFFPIQDAEERRFSGKSLAWRKRHGGRARLSLTGGAGFELVFESVGFS
jgi:hypothetical protein